MLYLETIESHTLDILRRLQRLPELSNTRLVGGTALALQLGHRISVDLDVFGSWDYSTDLVSLFAEIGTVEKQSGSPDGRMQFFFIDDIKVLSDCKRLKPKLLFNRFVKNNSSLSDSKSFVISIKVI